MTTLRPMTHDDVVAVGEVTIASFADLDRREGEQPAPVTPEIRERIHDRIRHFLVHDAAGSWVAVTDEDEVLAAALASVRGDLWGLSLLVVSPETQSRGDGRRLLEAALSHADGCARAVILSSRDPRAIRLYSTSGFDLHPQMSATGVPDLRAMPASVDRVRAMTSADAALLDSIDLEARRATRGPDHQLLGARSQGLVCDDDEGRGYAYVTPEGHVAALTAGDERSAGDLLWRCFDAAVQAGAKGAVSHMTAAQQWAMRTALAARLSVQPDGPVLWRGGSPPPAYLPSGAML